MDSMKKYKFIPIIAIFLIGIYQLLDPSPSVLTIKSKTPQIVVDLCQFLEEKLFGVEAEYENIKKFNLKGLVVVFRHGERSPIIPLVNLTPELEEKLFGVEAEYESIKKFNLKGLVVVFRHGERSPLLPLVNLTPELGNSVSIPDCSAFHNIDRKSFENYIELINSKDFRSFIKTDHPRSQNDWHPDRSKCSEGNITAEGALQIVRLGNYLRNKYSNTGLFDGKNVDIGMFSSYYQRTFQSAIAFISSFFYPDKGKIGKINLKWSNTTYFCMNQDCTCSKIAKFRKDFEDARSKLYFHKYSELSDELDKFCAEMTIPKVLHPLSFVDAILGRYACRRIPFPCFTNKNCLTLEKFSQVVDAAAELIHQMAPLSKPLRKLFVAESFPISQTIATISRKLRKSENSNQIRIFSAHDVTIVPFIFTLGLNATKRNPPYGSRLIFEIYQLKDKSIINDSVFIRVLLNGVDYTKNLQFCKNFYSGLCPARHFESFVRSSLFQDITNYQSITDMCNAKD
uniref:Uncharacterized protein n=1 Tax=Panagrolaimus sp. JU765 TaxID=591449 RepID=A0AC34QEX8_9BILA